MRTEFATTSWNQVLAARDGTGTEAREALEALCETYWYPLYAYVRHQGHDPEDAKDLTQAFFTHLFEKDALKGAGPSTRSFRAFLLASLKNLLSHEREKTQALKRGGGKPVISLDTAAAEKRFRYEPADRLTPEEVFERRWALTVVERAMNHLREGTSDGDHPNQFALLKSYLIGEEPRTPYREVASQLQMTEEAVKAAVRRLRKRFGRLLRAEIAQTLADPEETDDELRHLLLVIRPFEARRG